MSNFFNPVSKKFINPNIKDMNHYNDLVKQFNDDYEGTWQKFADEKINWFKKPHTTLDESNAPFYKWFVGGQLNVANQCVDRHLETKSNKTAIIFEGDNGDSLKITYKELSENVNKTANLLKNQYAIKKGDRVIIYMPMIPEACYAMLACAKIGAISSVVFGGFSAEALRDRIDDAQAKLVITADGGYRKGKAYMLKPVVDNALSKGCASIENVCVVKRNNEPTQWFENRDSYYNDLINSQSIECEAELVESEDPLFLLYTSGSTGKPKGVQHSTAGYILWAQMTMEWVFDLNDNDVYWCTADIGWITGHTYLIYGPLAAGGTTIMFEGVPTYPDAGRCWDIVQKHKVNQFYTAPTAIRMLHKVGADEPKKYDLSSLRVLGTVGEPIDPPAWKWYFETVGNSQCSIVDTYWQTETGGHIVSPLPAATPVKPSCATLPLPGIIAEVINEDGTPTEVDEKGFMCVTKPWPSMLRTVWNDDERFIKAYFSQCKKDGKAVYFTGDGAMKDENNYITITGRTDDVINVSGHRIGTAEIESAIKKYSNCASVAVVGKPHEIKGEGIFAYVVLKDENQNDVAKQINQIIKQEIGAIALCDDIAIVPDLPKTRSGKVMRRILRAIAKKEKVTQDISTLEDTTIVAKIENIVNS